MNSLSLAVSTPPQVFQPFSLEKQYRSLVLSQIPLILWGSLLFGLPGLLRFLVAVLSVLFTDFLLARRRSPSSFLLSQSLFYAISFGLLLPPGSNLLAVMAAGAISVLLCKWTYGGISGMWLHPALLGAVLLALLGSDHVFLQSTIGPDAADWLWSVPLTQGPPADGLATLTIDGVSRVQPAEIMRSSNLSQFPLDQTLTRWLNDRILNPFGAHLPGGYVASALGLGSGFFGGTSALLCLLVSIFLVERRLVLSRVAFTYLAMLTLGQLAMAKLNSELFNGDVLFYLSHGAPIMIAFWLLSDLTTTPSFRAAQIVYALLAAILTLFFQFSGSAQFAVIYAAMISKLFVPIIDRYIRPKTYGRKRRLES